MQKEKAKSAPKPVSKPIDMPEDPQDRMVTLATKLEDVKARRKALEKEGATGASLRLAGQEARLTMELKFAEKAHDFRVKAEQARAKRFGELAEKQQKVIDAEAQDQTEAGSFRRVADRLVANSVDALGPEGAQAAMDTIPVLAKEVASGGITAAQAQSIFESEVAKQLRMREKAEAASTKRETDEGKIAANVRTVESRIAIEREAGNQISEAQAQRAIAAARDGQTVDQAMKVIADKAGPVSKQDPDKVGLELRRAISKENEFDEPVTIEEAVQGYSPESLIAASLSTHLSAKDRAAVFDAAIAKAVTGVGNTDEQINAFLASVKSALPAKALTPGLYNRILAAFGRGR